MKVRNTGYANPYAGVSSPAPVERSDAAAATAPAGAAGIARTADVATVAGIPEGELTPKVRDAINQLMAEVQHLRQELDRARRRVDHLEQLADQDTLTPVLNRRAFVRELSRIMAYVERYEADTAILYFDVNGLKQINDTHGHAAGDAALNHVAQVLLDHVRGSDVVGRLGGDEFGVILAQSNLDGAAAKAKVLAEAIRAKAVAWNEIVLTVQASYGVHALSGGQEATEALDAADRAMYEHKRGNTTPIAGD